MGEKKKKIGSWKRTGGTAIYSPDQGSARIFFFRINGRRTNGQLDEQIKKK